MTEHRLIEVIAAEKLTPSSRGLVDFYQCVAAPADSLATVPV